MVSKFKIILVLGASFCISAAADAGVCVDYNSVIALGKALTEKPSEPNPSGKITARYAQARPHYQTPPQPAQVQHLGDGVWIPEPRQVQQSNPGQEAYARSRTQLQQSILRKQEAAKRPKPVVRKTTSSSSSQSRRTSTTSRPRASTPSPASVAQTIASSLGGGSCSGICF